MTPRVDRVTISLTCAGVTAIIIVTAGLRTYVPGWRWQSAAVTGLTWLLAMVLLARLRREVSPTGENTLAPISLATFVTLTRTLLIVLVAGFALVPPTGPALWFAGALYTLAALGDRADGALARRTGITALGARLDVAADALGLLVAPLVGVLWGRLPPWYLALACAYPALRAALALRRAWGRPVFPERLAPDPRARFFAGVQMTVVAASLYPVLPRELTWSAATVAMVPTLALFAGEWQLATRSAPDGRASAQRLDA